ncbi:MAG TPA: DUF2062 domain-containing protein [Bryobacteraceae bacterium]|nr:DUF2062 domain-containing protein [Bryobacteraceae bacterium]
MKALLGRLRESVAGLAPETIALIFVLGIVLGIFPVFGLPTLLCAAAAIVFRLNVAAIQLVNQVASPLQYLLLAPLGRAGASIIGARTSGNIIEHVLNGTWNAVVGWCCVCVPVGVVLHLVLAFLLQRRTPRSV